MKARRLAIVFLDAGTVDYGDLSLAGLRRLARLAAYPSTKPSAVERRSRHADVIITNKCVFDARLLARLGRLRLIAVAATGTNNVDLAAARRRGVAVVNVPGCFTEPVVQMTIAFLLALAGNLAKYNQAAHDGRWSRSPVFTLPAFPIAEVAGKTLGLVGYGRIGRRVAAVARALGMRVLVARIPGRSYSRWERRVRVTLRSLLARSDFVSLHAPLSRLTDKMINARSLRLMKRGAFLINMARGGLVDERALAGALASGRLGGAAADVLSQEPPPRSHVLLRAPNMLLTPHVSWASLEARVRLMDEITRNIRAFLAGKKRNRVV